MERHDDGAGAAQRALATAAIALAGFVLALTPIADYLDNALLDAGWRVLRRFDARPAPDEIAIIGIDDATVKSIAEPPGLWHATLGRALERVARARPRAIALDLPLPERSFDGVKPGVDRALFDGLAAAIDNGPFVAVLSIDARTRGARTIHLPFLALLGESRLGINLAARDADAVARRFSLLVPTEDGGFPTLEGRMCRALVRPCNDGLIHYGLGTPFSYMPLKNVLEMQDEALLGRLLRDRIVIIGEVQPFTDRLDVPVNLAGWEATRRDSPAVVVHAQTLRTALAGLAPQQARRPVVVLLLSLGALVFLVRDWRLAAVTGGLAAVGIAAGGIVALRGGVFLPVAAILATVALAVTARAAVAWRARRPPVSDIQHPR